VKVRGRSMAPRVSRYRIMTRGFYRNAPAGRSPDALSVHGDREDAAAGGRQLDFLKRCITIYRDATL